MKSRICMVVLVIALSGLAMSAVAGPTFQAKYNGNTGQGGFDADYALGDPVATAIGPNAAINMPGMFGTTSLDGTLAGGYARYDGGLNIPSTGTFEAWIEAPELRDTAHAFWVANADWSKGFNLQIHSAFGMLYRTMGGGDIFTAYDWIPGNWYHVAVTWGAGAADRALYVNATPKGSGAGIELVNMDHINIGAGTPGHEHTQYWGAHVDNVQIWDTIRTQNEIEADMADFPIVPEPASLLVLLTGAIGLAGVIRRRS